MALSLRLDQDLEKEVGKLARLTRMGKSELIRRCLKRFLPEMAEVKLHTPIQIYQKLQEAIPGSGHGRLSTASRSEISKRIRARHRS